MELRDFCRKVERCAYVASKQEYKKEEEIRSFAASEASRSGLAVSEGGIGCPVTDLILSLVPTFGISDPDTRWEESRDLWVAKGRDAWDHQRYIAGYASEPDVHPGFARHIVVDRVDPNLW